MPDPAPTAPERSRGRSPLRERLDRARATPAARIALRAFAIAAVIAAGLVAFGVFASSQFRAGPARFAVDVRPALPGTSIVVLPPFGSVSARTHAAPLQVRVSLRELDIAALERLAEEGAPDAEALDAYRADFTRGVTRSGLRGLAAATVAAGLVGWALRRRWREAAIAALVGVLLPAALLGWVRADFDADAFRSPTYRGAVTYAPALIDLVQQRFTTVESLRRQVEKTAKDLAAYYRAPQSLSTGGALPNTVRVLHVSDLHIDPVGLALAEDLAREFDVAFVIDTGDVNLYGSSIEASLVASELPTGPPRVFVPGNHESPDVVSALADLPNVRVLDETATVVAEVRVFGVPDPRSLVPDFEAESASAREKGERVADELRARLAAGEPTPAVIAVHDPAMERAFAGLAPLVLSGHTHTPSLEERDATWFLNSGTTGGVDFSGLRAEPHIPHSASVLYFTAELPRRLVAIDQIEVYGADRSSSLKRTVVEPELVGE